MGSRIELGPALQQAEAIPNEQRRTLQLSYAASTTELRRTKNLYGGEVRSSDRKPG
jgi:hypothetical protein